MKRIALLTALIGLAKQHVANPTQMRSSAELCLDDAEHLASYSDPPAPVSAGRRALDSLEYSVGILHADYTAAKALYREIARGA